MATDPTTIPSVVDLQKTKKSMADIDTFVDSGNDSFTDNNGQTRRTLTGINSEITQQLLELNKSRGYRVVGTFAAGFDYELFNDVGIDASGNSWIYVGTGAPVKTVTAGTVPSAPDYQQVTFNSIDSVVGLRDELDDRALYLTLAEAQASDLKEDQYVKLTDKDMCLYSVKNSIGVHPLSNGLWLHIAEQQDWVSPECYKNGNTTDDLAFALAVEAHNQGRTLKLGASYSLTSSHNLTGNISVECIYGVCEIDFSSNTSLSGYGLNFGDKVEALLPNLQNAINKQDTEITFSSSHGLSVGDYISIFNPSNGSFSGVKDEYKAGEFCKVVAVSGLTVTVDSPIIDEYEVNDVVIYKLEAHTLTLSGTLKVSSTGSKTNICGGIKLERVFESDITGLQSTFNNAESAINVDQCMNLTGSGLLAIQTGESASSGETDYGLSIINSQDLQLDGYFSATRHGVTHGGGTGVATIPCRRVRVNGVAKTTGGESTILAFDWHGNVEMCSFSGHVIGGVNFGGDKNKVSGRVTASKSGMLAYASTPLGFNFDFSGVTFESTRANSIDFRGAFDIGGNSSALSSNTVRGGCLDLSNTKWILTGTNVRDAIRIRNRGCSENMVINLDGAKFLDVNVGLSNLLTIETISGVNIDELSMVGVYTSRSLSSNITGVNNVKGFSSSGFDSIDISTASTQATKTITFDKEFPVPPKVTAILNDISDGPSGLLISVDTITTTSFVVKVNRADFANFANSLSREFTWKAEN